MRFRDSRGAGLTLADQLLSSATNFVPAIFAANILTPGEFGVFALLQAVYVIAIGALRAGLVETAIVHVGLDGEARNLATTTCMWLFAVLVPMTVVAAVLLDDTSLAVTVVAMGVVVVQDTQRMECLATKRETDAVASDGLWLLIIAAAMALMGAGHYDPNAVQLFATWGFAALPGVVLVAVIRRWWPRPRAALDFVVHFRATASTHLADWALRQGVTQLTIYVIAAGAGLAILGHIRLGQLLLGPVNVVFAAIQIVAMPRLAMAAKGPALEFWRRVRALQLTQTILPMTLGGVILLIPDDLLREILGEQAVGLKPYLAPQVVLVAIGGVSASAQTAIKVLHLRVQLLQARIVTAAVTFVCTIVGAGLAYSAVAGLWGLAAGSAVSALLWQRVLRAGRPDEEVGRPSLVVVSPSSTSGTSVRDGQDAL